jgi:peroxiredoxin
MPDFDVTELPSTDHVAAGETAPDFTRPLVGPEFWEDRTLSSLTAVGPVLLVFHPMDGDFVPVYIWQAVADRGWEADHDVRPVGLSISSPYEHGRFLDEWALDYQLFSDPSNEIAEQYGIVNDLDGMAGVAEPRPAVYLLEPDRTVAYAWVAGEWPAFPDYDEVEASIEAL